MAQRLQTANLQDLGDVPICIAIDKSGSTYGRTLAEEVTVVQRICSLVSPRNESPAQLLPWCDKVERPIQLPTESRTMNNLISEGGTNPSILYSEPESLQALRKCGLWFLLTDGQIEDTLVQEFAVSTAELGLHGTACIVIIFGSMMDGRPATCDVSVGVAAYAVAPDCLFLFHDIATKGVFIMQAKGCFKALLVTRGSVPVQPVLNKYTTWAELPTMDYDDLAKVQIAPPRKISSDEFAFQDGLVIDLRDLYSGQVDDLVVEEIVKNQDNLKSLVIAEMAKGTGRDLQKWLDSQQSPKTELNLSRPDMGGKAQELVTRLLMRLEANDKEEPLDSIRLSLREAHQKNLSFFAQTVRNHLDEVSCFGSFQRNIRFARTSSLDFDFTGERSIGYAYDVEEDEDAAAPLPSILKLDKSFSPHGDKAAPADKLGCTFLPGFRRRPDGFNSEFTGVCMLCKEHAILTILTKSPPEMITSGFPAKGAGAPLAFPLAMSSFAETDIISFFVCCDPCALYLVKNCTSPLKDVVTGALPLTNVEENLPAWIDVVDVALKGRFRKTDLSTLLVAILDRKILENRSLPPRAKPSDGVTYQDALIWAKKELAKFSEVPLTLSPSFRSRHSSPRSMGNRKDSNLWTIISDQTLIDPGEESNLDIAMLRYPVPGFMVLIRLMRDKGTSEEQLKVHMIQRLMYAITEMYFAPAGTNTMRKSLQNLLSADDIKPKFSNDTSQGGDFKLNISTDMLASHQLIDANTLTSFQTMDGFKHAEEGTRPAMAVYLHALSLKGPSYCSAIDYFNSLKVHVSLGRVIIKPFAISEGLAADLMLQI
ncbi:hypothetical protein BKA65DRAFT_481235 [Rhexocercosporidium sp. MPI-PUGE-AT-0058]|nr:hypothetical protein BKA65DRAFT_481235 [Rhexocercosporidium sp. MPI-PUGE-AT-0058]